MRDFSVSMALNGWIVRVGCQTLVYTDIEKMAADFKGYAQNPVEFEKQFLKDAINRRFTMVSAPVPADIGTATDAVAADPQRTYRDATAQGAGVVPGRGCGTEYETLGPGGFNVPMAGTTQIPQPQFIHAGAVGGVGGLVLGGRPLAAVAADCFPPVPEIHRQRLADVPPQAAS